MPQNITYRKCRKEDLPRVSQFRKEFFPHEPSVRSHETEYYEWKCYRNPFAQGEIWLAEDGETLVGMKSMTPKRVKVLGKVLDATETGDTYTHPEYQRRGIFTTLFKTAREHGIEKGIEFIYGCPNEISLAGIEKLNYAQIPFECCHLIKPLSPKQFLQDKLRFSILASALCFVTEFASRTILRIGVGLMKKSDAVVTHESVFPDDVDTLFEHTSKNYEVILNRTRDYLKWRYFDNPDTYSTLIARNKEGAILGYLTTKLASFEDKNTGFIVDFLTLEDNPGIFGKLLAVAFEEFFQQKVNIVHTWVIKGNFYHKIFLKLGFIQYGRNPIICYKSEIGNKVLEKPRKWHLTLGDTDNI